jgi:small ligand-binding sensory domain FIST
MFGSSAPGAKPSPVLAPQGVYVTGDDHLLLTVLNAATGVTVRVGGRMLDAVSGRAVPFNLELVPATDRSASTTVVRLQEGWLQQATIVVSGGTPLYGQTYARLDIVRGDGPGRTVLGTLAQGLITAQVRQAFPGAVLQGPLEAPGTIRSITGTDPAAGAEVSETVPTGARWRLHALRVALTTDATVANRETSLTLDDGTTIYAQMPAGEAQTASAAFTYTWAVGLIRGAPNQGGSRLIPIPPLWLLAGHRIRTLTTNIQAGDNYGAPQLLVEESLEGA